MFTLARYAQRTIPRGKHLRDLLNLKFHEAIFKPGEYLIKAGRIPKKCFYIEKGLVKNWIVDENKKRVISAIRGEGLIIDGNSAFYRQIPAPENSQALTEVTAYYIDYRNHIKLEETEITYNQLWTHLMMRQMSYTEQMFLVHASDHPLDKLKHIQKMNKTLIKRIEKEDLANWLKTEPGVIEYFLEDFKK